MAMPSSPILRWFISLILLPQLAFSLVTIHSAQPKKISPRICTSTVLTSNSSVHAIASTVSYYHADAHGNSGRLLNPSTGPRDLKNSLAWSWHHPQGRYYTMTNGVLIDEQKNLYLSAMDAIRKFSPDGELLWTYCSPSPWPFNTMPYMTSLSQGSLFGSAEGGLVFALSMETGKELWLRKLESVIGSDTANVQAHGGIVIAGTGRCVHNSACDNNGNAGCQTLHGLNAIDGSSVWAFTPDVPVWNFYATFLDDGTFAYQDLEGKMYRNKLADGALIWKNGGIPGSWTDGCAGLGPNGTVLGVTNHGPNVCGHDMCKADVTAYSLNDGTVRWKADRPASTNAFPAVGPAFGRSGLQTVVNNDHGQLSGHDTETGEVLWTWQGSMDRCCFKGDKEGMATRLVVQPTRPQYVPNFWSNVAIGADGTVYGGMSTGRFYALRDSNGDGQIDPLTEVSEFDADASFPGTGPAVAPGMLAFASIDTLFVFKG
mmetsp:Transcript_29055/g.65625  ORF Transcript_29055/g.65625 Transcript_29055/m.65625 type:complete len:486 (-) Transcript_29055:49-1506(-)